MDERVKIQRSNFGGPWKDHSVGQWSGAGDERTWTPGIPRDQAEAMVHFLNAMPRRRSQATYRVVPLEGSETAGSENS